MNRRKQYRYYIGLYKYARDHGIGWFVSWRPDTFRGFIQGYRQIIVLDVVLVVVILLLVILKKI